MMNRFPQSEADKGSQKWIQELVNQKPDLLNNQIKRILNFPKEENIEWLSPLKEDAYSEYCDQSFLDLLGVKLKKIPLSSFWPRQGPHWDALGKSSHGKLLLVEAKSHIPELLSTMRAKDEKSIKRILGSLEKTRLFLNANPDISWSHPFYQYTNRLAHLYLLRQNELPAYLVLVYFINDIEMNGPTKAEQWEGAKELLHSYLGIGSHKLQQFITDVFIDVHHIRPPRRTWGGMVHEEEIKCEYCKHFDRNLYGRRGYAFCHYLDCGIRSLERAHCRGYEDRISEGY